MRPNPAIPTIEPSTVEPSSDAVVEIAVTDRDKGKRIDRFLVEALLGHPFAPSRAELARWIELGRVTFARARLGSASSTGPAKAADKVRLGDVILVRPAAPAPTEALPDPSVVFDVVYVDDDLVVVDKPAGLVVHPAAGHLTGTLVNGLLARGYFDRDLLELPTDEEREDDEAEGPVDPVARSRPGIVHRIDKDTSGILVVARTAFAREKLKVQFAEHTCDRVYEALATGVVGTETYATLYGRNPRNRMMFSSKVRDGKRAVTRVAPKATFGALATHLECRLETGRTHQIRVHLADAGHSLLADRMYGVTPKNEDVARIAAALGRQALHARRLGFVHPRTGKSVVFESESPSDFRLALEALRALV